MRGAGRCLASWEIVRGVLLSNSSEEILVDNFGGASATGGVGNDTLNVYSGSSATIDAGSGNDLIGVDHLGSAIVSGGDGNDTLDAEGGTDSIGTGKINGLTALSKVVKLNFI